MTRALWFRMINIFIIIPVPALIPSVWSAAARKPNLSWRNAPRHARTQAGVGGEGGGDGRKEGEVEEELLWRHKEGFCFFGVFFFQFRIGRSLQKSWLRISAILRRLLMFLSRSLLSGAADNSQQIYLHPWWAGYCPAVTIKDQSYTNICKTVIYTFCFVYLLHPS